MTLRLISIKAKSGVEVSLGTVLFVAHRSLDVTGCYINHLDQPILVHEKPTTNVLFMVFQNLSNLEACVIFTKGA